MDSAIPKDSLEEAKEQPTLRRRGNVCNFEWDSLGLQTRDQQRRHGDGMEDPSTGGGVTATYIRKSDKM